MNEDMVMQTFESEADSFLSKYENYFEDVAGADRFAGNTFTKFDAWQLGKRFEKWQAYEQWVSETASASDLGTIPNIALDIITANYATSVAPLFCSMQTISEEQGTVYFRNVFASDDRAGITAGDKTFTGRDEAGGVLGWDKAQDIHGYASAYAESIVATTVGGGSEALAINLAVPVRSNIPVDIVIGAYSAKVIDGQVLSTGEITGTTFDYTTGSVTLTFIPAEAGLDVIVKFHQDFELSLDVPTIKSALTTTSLLAEVSAVKENVSTLKSFQLNARFGKIAEDEALQDLVGLMADSESRRAIQELSKLADIIGTPIEFDTTKAPEISEYEHRQAFRYSLNDADSAININAGRGSANRYIAGHKACQYIASLPGFQPATASLNTGPHLYGTLDDKPVIRTIYVATTEILAVWHNPASPFESAVVIGDYMPMFITSTMQVSNNPLMNQRAVATWKAYKGVVPQFVKRINLVTS